MYLLTFFVICCSVFQRAWPTHLHHTSPLSIKIRHHRRHHDSITTQYGNDNKSKTGTSTGEENDQSHSDGSEHAPMLLSRANQISENENSSVTSNITSPGERRLLWGKAELKKDSTVMHFTFDPSDFGSNLAKEHSGNANYATSIDGKMGFLEYSRACGNVGIFKNTALKFKFSKTKGLPSKSIALAAWVRIDTTEKSHTIFNTGEKGKLFMNFFIKGDIIDNTKLGGESTNARLKFELMDKTGNTKLIDVESPKIVPAGIWTHVAASYDWDNGKVKLFVNGKKVAEGNPAFKQTLVPWKVDLAIGGPPDTTNRHMYFSGSMDEFYMFKQPLVTAEADLVMKRCNLKRIGRDVYFITLDTADIPKSWFFHPDAIYLKLIGEQGQLGEFRYAFEQNLKKGSSELIKINGPDLGKLKGLVVRKFKEDFGDDWKLNKVMVNVNGRHHSKQYQFSCNCWFKEKEPNTIQRYINAEPSVNGAYSVWSSWSGCGSGLCGGESKVRTRTCTNPTSSGGGRKCSGPSFEKVGCPIDGGWSAWSSWSECSKTCDGSTVTRTRLCDNPAPANGGKPCPGEKQEAKTDCENPCQVAPVDGEWSAWTPWSACAKTCGGSTVTRSRTCSDPPPSGGGQECPGDEKETADDCTTPCPVPGGWGEWGAWSACDVPCGKGETTRERSCNKPKPMYNGADCTGKAEEMKSCDAPKKCPETSEGGWSAWGTWGPCSEKKYCNKGLEERTRQCNKPLPSPGGGFCPGASTVNRQCPKTSCTKEEPVTADSRPLETDSVMTKECEATEEFKVTGTKSKDVPPVVFDKHLRSIATILKSGYFAKTTKKEKDSTLTKFCFNPTKLLTVAELINIHESYKKVPDLPGYTKADSKDNVQEILVYLKPDNTLNAAEFVLGIADKYAPNDKFVLSNVTYKFRAEGEKSTFVARGIETLAAANFDVEVVAMDGSPVEAFGKTDSEMSLLALQTVLALPTTAGFIGSLATQFGFENPVDKLKGQLEATTTGAVDKVTGGGAGNAVLEQIKESIKLQIKTVEDDLLKKLDTFGLNKLEITGITMGVNIAGDTIIRRISGLLKSSSFPTPFVLEMIKEKNYALGLALSKSSVGDFLSKLFKKKIEAFKSCEDAGVGVAYVPVGFRVSPRTKFEHAPLTLAGVDYPTGVMVAASCKVKQDCGADNFCKFVQLIMGKGTQMGVSGTLTKTDYRASAGLFDRPIKGDIKFTKIVLFAEGKFLPQLPKFGFEIQISIPVEGEVELDGEIQPAPALKLSGKVDFGVEAVKLSTVGVELSMTGLWRKAFKISFLSIGDISIGMDFTIGSPVPTSFEMKGRIEFGIDCIMAKDFAADGHCIRGSGAGSISANPLDNYFYGELSAITLGKIVRMMGLKVKLAKRLEDTGFPDKTVVSVSASKKKIVFGGESIDIPLGVHFAAAVNILGFKANLRVEVSDERIHVSSESDPIKLTGAVQLYRSLKETTKGPRFFFDASRKDLSITAYLQGAADILGAKVELMINLTLSRIEAQFGLDLFGSLSASVFLSAGYGPSLESTNFVLRVTILSQIKELVGKAMEKLSGLIDAARIKLQKAQEAVREKKQSCRTKISTHCRICKSTTCDEAMSNCEEAEDDSGRYSGGSVTKTGHWYKHTPKTSENVASTSRSYGKSLIRYLKRVNADARAQTSDVGHVLSRRRRYVGEELCDSISPGECALTDEFCKGSCSLKDHILRGACGSLDIVINLLHALEIALGWTGKAADFIGKYGADIFDINKLSFETNLSAKLSETSFKMDIDVTVFGVQLYFKLDMDLKDLKANAAKVVDAVIEKLKKIWKARTSQDEYDKPSTDADLELSGAFRIQAKKGEECLAPKTDTVSSPLMLVACEGNNTYWEYTLTGQLLNIQSGYCLASDKLGPNAKLIQKICDSEAKTQKFDCGRTENSTVFLEGTTQCIAIEGKNVKIKTCDEGKEEEHWLIKGDPRLKICDKFVPDIAIKKPATMSSVYPVSKTVKKAPAANLAVDGNMNTLFSGQSCAHTKNDKDPWIKIDLEKEHIITDVTVVNPQDSPESQLLSNFEIRVGMLPDFKKNPSCGERVSGTLQPGEAWTMQCIPPIPGRYVSVQRIGQSFLTLCEVAVFARLDNRGKCSVELAKKRSEIMNYDREEEYKQLKEMYANKRWF